MHVRKKAEQCGVVRQRAARLDAIVRHSRWDYEVIVRQLQSEDALRGSALREYQSDARLVLARVSIRSVVHLKNESGSRRDPLSFFKCTTLRMDTRARTKRASD